MATPSVIWWRSASKIRTAGATSDAKVSPPSSTGDRRAWRGGAGRATSRTEGCTAAAPTSV